MKYKFDLRVQCIYGLSGLIFSFILIYLFTKQIDYITPLVVGAFNFGLAGFYTTLYK